MARPKKNTNNTAKKVQELLEQNNPAVETEPEQLENQEPEANSEPEQSDEPKIEQPKIEDLPKESEYKKTRYFVGINYGREITVTDINGKRVAIRDDEEVEVTEDMFKLLKKDTIKLKLGPTQDSLRIVDIDRYKCREE